MKLTKKIISVLLALIVFSGAFSCYISASAASITGLKIINAPEKRVFYKGTDWIYGMWVTDEENHGKCLLKESKFISFTHNPGGGQYGERGMIDMAGLIVEVSYSDGSKKQIKYEETLLKSGFYKSNILFSPKDGKEFFIGTNIIEVYLSGNADYYDSYEIEITDKEKDESYFKIKENSTASVNSSGIISGLKTGLTSGQLANYFDYSGVEISFEKSNKSFKYYGTGSLIYIKYPDEKIEKYTVLIYGDIDGNGVIDFDDSSLVSDCFTDDSLLSDIQKKAADVDGMRRITADDLTVIKAAASGNEQIPQF